MIPRRIATLSVHTSPLHQPGTGDAGGMNVYIVEVSKRLAALGIEVEIFTRATAGDLPPVVEMAPGVYVRHITAGPYEGLSKEDLPGQLCAFTSGVLRAEAMHKPGYYELIHSHYWLSGQVGWLATERWGVPLVHSMHTLARVKNAALADSDTPEPQNRLIGESQVVDAADRLIANTEQEAEQLVGLYGADPSRVAVVNPGVDLDTFKPGDQTAARARLGLPRHAQVLLFAGRIQPLKAPDILLRLAADLLRRDPERYRDLVVVIVGGPSGTGLAEPHQLTTLARRLGISDRTRFVKPVGQAQLAEWYRAADLALVPSFNESFGLVAVEAQACGTPVVAAKVGGLVTAVRDGESGILIPGHDPVDYASACAWLLDDPGRLEHMRLGARQHATGFGWGATADRIVGVYSDALAERWASRRRVSSIVG
ncbi:MAG TPA: D-inositol-3-phosphate glycosyltransferase [Actinocrinis sp.]|nr:D-inositol-3-phosphate glycosyltransferase [Actinocrinis sp.]HZU57984.1 D-inositol-3-phosphate glycosyltransferase [Actinocrinis sp.]